MKAIRAGARGPAVEDIQKRLLSLGYDIGPTGVDGVLLEHTLEALIAFKRKEGLGESPVVDDHTWSALVDATFTLGNRTLYLRMPHFHGSDVLQLQRALNVLGFPCGEIDGIFGARCERAVREFQFNVGIPADGICGPATFDAVGRLRHVWENKDAARLEQSQTGFIRAEKVLNKLRMELSACDEASADVAERIANLAHATSLDAAVWVGGAGQGSVNVPEYVLKLSCSDTLMSIPTVQLDDYETLAARLKTALSVSVGAPVQIAVDLSSAPLDDERNRQRAAILVLDAICVALA